MRRALCAYIDDPDQFFPERGQSRRRIEAQKICMKCPVIQDCRNYRAKIDERFGIWGGESQTRKT